MASQQAGSVHYPFVQDPAKQSLLRAYTVEDTIASSIRAFIMTDPGSRRMNPMGSMVPTLLMTLIPSSQLSGIEDEIKNELTQQFPGVTFDSVIVTPVIDTVNNYKVSRIKLGITFSTPITELSSLTIEIS